MTRSGLSASVHRVSAVVPVSAQVKVGIEAAGHYYRPVLDYGWPPGWEVLELNPAHVAEQRRVAGRRRVKTDVIDLEAVTELVLAGRGRVITDREVCIGELAAWATHRSRRVATRSATKNQLLGQLDRAFPGLTRALPDVLGTKIGRLVATEFADPARLSALGVNRLIRFAAARDVQLRRAVAERLVTAARDALPTRDGAVVSTDGSGVNTGRPPARAKDWGGCDEGRHHRRFRLHRHLIGPRVVGHRDVSRQ
jgi:transposase